MGIRPWRVSVNAATAVKSSVVMSNIVSGVRAMALGFLRERKENGGLLIVKKVKQHDATDKNGEGSSNGHQAKNHQVFHIDTALSVVQ